ncbi:Sterol regulatory element-binding protein ECM22-like protein 1 [Stagonosporopsis vannaccii]|nr:Sterol regulatory element-binding protein ECM22-like protein 1 [Stagonosporopsis vannaccii]
MDSATSSSADVLCKPLKIRRKSHRKSRNGCVRCKRRRVKCDETKPACTRCVEFGIVCDYNSATLFPVPAPLERPKFIHSQEYAAPKQKGRPRTIWGDEVPVSSLAGTQSLSLQDFRLLNHFITRAKDSPDPSAPKSSKDPLHDQALLFSFAYPCILHLILEFSALELARQCPGREGHYCTLAERHSVLGLQGATALLRQVDTGDYHAAYTAATFACINYLARGPQPGEYLLFSVKGPSQWLPLLHGIRTIIDLVGIEKIAAGPTGQQTQKTVPVAKEPARIVLKCPDVHWNDQFERLEMLVASSPDSATDSNALCKLRRCFEATYGLDGVYKGNEDQQNAFIWPYQLGSEFAAQLQSRKPLSLVVAAHYALLLQNYEFMWYMNGWADQILAGIREVIDVNYCSWLDWPLAQAQRTRIERERGKT